MSTRPTIIDITRFVDGIRDQQDQGACKAFQIINAAGAMAKVMGIDLPELSAQQLYNDTQIKMGTLGQDKGSYTSSAEWAAMNIGIAKESSFTYGGANRYAIPSAEVHAEAGQFKIKGFTHTNIEKSDIGVANYIANMLLQGKPVLVDAYVHYGFGVDPNAFLNPINGGHGFVAMAVNFETRTYTGFYTDGVAQGGIWNQWGTDWAVNGMGTLKFSDLPGIGPTSGGAWGNPYQDLLGLSTIDGFMGIDLVWTTPLLEVARYYAVMLDRAGEIEGVRFWAGYDNVFSNAQMADMMIGSAEGHALYGGKTDSQFLDALYMNALGRAADQAGKDYFLGLLAGGQSRGTVAAGMIDYTYANSTDQAGHDFLLNTTNLSAYMSISMQYGGGNDAATAAALNQVTSDANQLEIIKVGLPEVLFG